MVTERISYPLNEGLALIGEPRTAGYKAINEGWLKTYKSGRRRMVTAKALHEYVALKERQSEGRQAA